MIEQSTRTILIIGDVDTGKLKNGIRLDTKFLVNHDYQDGLRTAHWLRKRNLPVDAVVIAFRRSRPREPISPKRPLEFVSRITQEFGEICPILVVSKVAYQRLPFTDKGPILCHLDRLAQELTKALS